MVRKNPGAVVSRKRAHGRYTLLCAQTRGWADTCTMKKCFGPLQEIEAIVGSGRIFDTGPLL